MSGCCARRASRSKPDLAGVPPRRTGVRCWRYLIIGGSAPMREWKIPLFRPFFGKAERKAVVAVLKSGYLTLGRQVRRFEAEWEDRLRRYCVMVNSGSSANLLMAEIMKEHHAVKSITAPALCWP